MSQMGTGQSADHAETGGCLSRLPQRQREDRATPATGSQAALRCMWDTPPPRCPRRTPGCHPRERALQPPPLATRSRSDGRLCLNCSGTCVSSVPGLGRRDNVAQDLHLSKAVSKAVRNQGAQAGAVPTGTLPSQGALPSVADLPGGAQPHSTGDKDSSPSEVTSRPLLALLFCKRC